MEKMWKKYGVLVAKKANFFKNVIQHVTKLTFCQVWCCSYNIRYTSTATFHYKVMIKDLKDEKME